MDERAIITQARSALVLLLATCIETQTALGAAANVLDTDMAHDLDLRIEPGVAVFEGDEFVVQHEPAR